MAQTGYTPIQIYSSSTGGASPSASNLTNSTLGSELAINITDGKLFYKDNAGSVQVIGWKTVPTTAGGTGLTSYTAGDLLYFASGATFSKLAIGASTTILTSSGTAPQWSSASSITVGAATNIAGGAAGSVPYQTGVGATSLLAIGSAYQALQVNAGGTAPSWQPSATSVMTAQGDLLYASAANTLARLAKNTTATRYLANTGTTNNPQWDQVNLTNGVTGTLPVGNGGTGLTTLVSGRVPYGNGTSALNNVAGFYFSTTGYSSDYAVGVEGASSASLVLTCGGAYSGAGIRVTSSGVAVIFAGGADRMITSGTAFYPNTDNAYTLGTSGNRWSTVYAATGTINTSDARYKQDIRDLSTAEKLTAQDIKKLLKSFRFKDSVQEKGDGARIHFGVIAQEVQGAFVKNGLNPENYGLFCYDKWDDAFESVYRQETVVEADGMERIVHIDTGEKMQTQIAGDRFGIRYEELLAFIIAAM